MTFLRPLVPDKTAFGEAVTAQPTPIVHLGFPYNINTDLIEKRENNAGTITQANNMAVMQSGAAANSAAHMLSKMPVKYQPGQGALCRFTALFTAGAANSVQVAGLAEVGDGFLFGYNGTAFSVLRRELGVPEIQTLTITTGAVTATGNITINLDTVAKLVAVTSGDSTRQVAVKIADADFSDTGLGWSATVDSEGGNDTVIFKAWSDGNKSGTFSLVDTDTTGTVGAFAETVAGVATTNNWTAQASWSEDIMDGTGPSGMTLDPTKGNVYQIRYQWLGFGTIDYSIENSVTGQFQLVHRIEYANANTAPSLQNPTLPLHIMSKNAANTSNLTVKTSSMAGLIEGAESFQALHKSAEGTNAAIGTTQLPILTIKNNVVYQSTLNRVMVLLGYLSISADATKPLTFRLYLNPSLTGPVSFTAIDVNTSVMSFDVAATGFTGGEELLTISLDKVGSEVIDLHPLNFKIAPGDTIMVSAVGPSGSGHDGTASITWGELF